MKDSNCIFCKIANGEIPTNTLYEDEYFRVIFDLSPASKGHALIVPKEHYRGVFELGDEEASRVFVVAKKVATALKKLTGCEGFNILQNNEEIAGQTVFHFHTHLIPRYTGDGMKITWNHGNPSDEELKEMSDKIKELLK